MREVGRRQMGENQQAYSHMIHDSHPQSSSIIIVAACPSIYSLQVIKRLVHSSPGTPHQIRAQT